MNDASTFSEDSPCGPSLEYDADYAVLASRLQPRREVQYGDFVNAPDPVNWAEVERECRRMLLRTRDINLHVWLCRARTRLAQAQGLAESLDHLAQDLHAWPEAIHPQLVIEGNADPMVRAGALAALADPEGLMADVRDIAVVSGTAFRLTVRDVERALIVPRPPDAPTPASVRRHLEARQTADGDDCTVAWLAKAAESLHSIDAWCQAWLGDDAPALGRIVRLLAPFAVDEGPGASSTFSIEPTPSGAGQACASGNGSINVARSEVDAGAPGSRGEALMAIRGARAWFECHEPSSPVAVLLLQAERLVGKRFSEVADAIPLDLLRRWEAPPDGEPSEARA